MWDLFISHASEDKAVVRPIAEALRRAMIVRRVGSENVNVEQLNLANAPR